MQADPRVDLAGALQRVRELQPALIAVEAFRGQRPGSRGLFQS
jgi:hypothetical protein